MHRYKMDQRLLQEGESFHHIPMWAMPKLNVSPIGTGEVPILTMQEQKLQIDSKLEAMLKYYHKPANKKNCEIFFSTTQSMFKPENPQPKTITDLVDVTQKPWFLLNFQSVGMSVMRPADWNKLACSL